MTISSGTISETPGTLPAIKITEPYSPTARAKDNAKPVSRGGSRVGKVTRQQVREIAEIKMKDLNAKSIEAAEKIIEGTARSMGITVAS